MSEYSRLIISLLLFIGFLSSVSAEEIFTWQVCLEEAKKNNPSLISAAEGINQEKAGKAITASSLYPQVSADVDASKAESEDKTTDSYSYGASAQQLVFDGFKTVNNVNAAKQNLAAARQNYRFTSSDVRLKLRTAFVNLLKAQELSQVTADIVKIRRDNLMLITLRYESGLEHKGALLTAEANLAAANFELSQAKRNIEFAQRQLTKEMGRREFRSMFVRGDFIIREAANEQPDFEELVKNNPLVLQAAARKNSASFGIKSAYANFSPRVSGTAAADKSSSHWPPQNEQWNAGLSLSMPIFEGGLRLAQVSQAQAKYNQAQADERSVRDTAIVNLEQAWAALKDAIGAVEVQSKALEASEERAKIAEAQYSVGFITFDNWIIIENDLVGTKKSYLDAQAGALFAEADWIKAKGETLEYAQ